MKYSALLLWTLGLATSFISAYSADGSAGPAVARRIGKATEKDSAGVAVLVARDGKIIYQAGFGLADVAKKTPITPETKFRIGSVTKQFTAAAILKLSEDGKLALNDRLSKYYPDFPNGAAITLRQLLNHTSGIRSYTSKPGFMERVVEPITPAELIEWFKDDPPDFEPGTRFAYDNSGYFLLGEIVAKVSGKPYGEYLRTTFFEPLGMTNTGVYLNAAPPPGIARGYSYQDGESEPAMDWDMSWAGGAGALYSTVGDLFRWNEALFNGKVLSGASLKAATTPVSLPADSDGMNYGFGLTMFTLKGLPAVAHGGGLNGWSSDLVRLPEQRCTIVVLTNALPPVPGVEAGRISRALMDEYLADEINAAPKPTEDTSIDSKTFREYVGRYDYTSNVMTVSFEDQSLFGRMGTGKKRKLFAKAKDVFFTKEVDGELTFLRDNSGEVIALRHSQDGRTTRAPKLREVAMSVEQLDVFTGRYNYGQAIMTVTRDGSQLFAQLQGQPKYPIFATSADEFEWRVVPAKVKFVKGKDGRIEKAVHTQNGATFDAPRVR